MPMDKKDIKLVLDYVEYSFPEFQEYLESVHEIESTEAEFIIDSIKSEL